MRSLLAFWIGGGGSGPVIILPSSHSIFRPEVQSEAGSIYGAEAEPGAGSIYRQEQLQPKGSIYRQ